MFPSKDAPSRDGADDRSFVHFDLGKYELVMHMNSDDFFVRARVTGTTLESDVTDVNGIAEELLADVNTEGRIRDFEDSTWVFSQYVGGAEDFLSVIANAWRLFTKHGGMVTEYLDKDRAASEWDASPSLDSADDSDVGTRIFLDTGHTPKEWAQAVAARLIDEWANRGECEPDELHKFQDILAEGLTRYPEGLREIIGTSLIEETYFDDKED